jgi:hypothetical protein
MQGGSSGRVAAAPSASVRARAPNHPFPPGSRAFQPPHPSTRAAVAPRGHGTQILEDRLVATQCGMITRTDKLISVKPPKER